nr:hypothetical protein [Verrucomicrobiota bacterium]
EYNHAAPNTFSAEAFPLICAYAAQQDWDGVFAFAYSHRTDDWDKRYFPSFFDIDQHPLKMATLPASIGLFVRGDVRPAKGENVRRFTVESAIEAARAKGPRIDAELEKGERTLTYSHRVGVRLAAEADRAIFTHLEWFASRFPSDTGELEWDMGERVVTVNAPRSKAVIGSLKRRQFDLGGVQITAGETRQDWAVIQLTVLDGADFANAKRLLVTATGYTENTGMKWNAEKSSVGREWGRAPSLVEGVAAKITLPTKTRLKAWALDDRGQRRAELPVQEGAIEIGPGHKTLWYELIVE